MVKGNFKQIDLLRKRRDSNYFLVEPNFIDKKKFIKKGILSGSILIIITLILGTQSQMKKRMKKNKF